jgi:phosphate transport system permease protein
MVDLDIDFDLPHVVFSLFSLITVAVTVFFIGFIFYTAYPVFASQGLGFLTGSVWNYNDSVYGIRIFIIDTVIVTLVTLILAVPLSLFTAVFLSEFASPRAAGIVRPFIELLVGIPSVVYGIFGLRVLGDIFKYHINPFLDSHLGFISIFQNVSTSGTGVLLASTVLAIMILPTVVSISEDSMRAVPYSYREGAYALGSTKWETIRHIILPAASSGIISAIILGTMRAMGETMAIVMLLGNSLRIPSSVSDLGYAMTSKILNDINYHVAIPEHRSALFGIAAVLFAIEIVFVALARKMSDRI